MIRSFIQPRYSVRTFLSFSVFFLVISGFTWPPVKCSAEDYFFSAERIGLNLRAAGSISGKGGTAGYIEKFLLNFETGRAALISGDIPEAEQRLFKARDAWPEYFDTDFLIAILFERLGEERKAARFYKSYLNKLKAFYSGEYRISGPIIYSLNASGAVSYGEAYQRISDRLRTYGIDIDRVSPAARFPVSFIPLTAGAVLVGVFLLVRFTLIPALEKRYWLKNPPEGFWVCSNCGEDNPVLAYECQKCGRKKDG